MQRICDGFAAAHEIEIKLELRKVFDVLVNDEALAHEAIGIAKDLLPEEDVYLKQSISMASEDMADLLAAVPGAYFTLGHAGDLPVHHPSFLLDEAILPLGASLLAHIVEKRGDQRSSRI